MEKISWMTDFFPVRLLSLAVKAEALFQDCLLSCPRNEEEGIIDIDRPETLERLTELRLESLFLSLAAFEAYLGFYADRTARKLEEETPGLTLAQALDRPGTRDFIKYLPARQKRRYEFFIQEFGNKPVSLFLKSPSLTLDDKLFYFPLIRTGKTVDYRDGYMKKLTRLIAIRAEILSPDFNIAPFVGKISSARELGRIKLHHKTPERLTPERSFSAEFVEEPYNEGHLLWELLHCYPPRAVAEAVQYIHQLDLTDHHIITSLRAVRLADEKGEPLMESRPLYSVVVEVKDEGG